MLHLTRAERRRGPAPIDARQMPSGSRKIRHTANAISRYSVVQTGPKIQLGGLNDGLTRPAYQGARLGYVASWPTTDVAATAMIARMPKPTSRLHEDVVEARVMIRFQSSPSRYGGNYKTLITTRSNCPARRQCIVIVRRHPDTARRHYSRCRRAGGVLRRTLHVRYRSFTSGWEIGGMPTASGLTELSSAGPGN